MVSSPSPHGPAGAYAVIVLHGGVVDRPSGSGYAAVMTIFYSIFHGQGRAILADTFEVEDPFALEPRVILEKVTSLGMTPVVDRPGSDPWPAPGVTYRVYDQDHVYLVTMGREAEHIAVQEERSNDDPYSEAE